MIKIFLDLLQFLFTNAQLITSLVIFTLLSIWLAKSIKKNSKTYYIILAIPFFLAAIPFTLRLCGVETVNLVGVSVLGHILRDYIHMGTLGHPLLIIIMYMGALDPKVPFVKKLMSIRKELSIIVGFPVLTHSLIRTANNFVPALRFFTHNEEYMANTNITSEFGAFLTNFSFVLGIVMLVIFIPLWITSFDSVRLRMSAVKWKKLQKWAYVLYVTLFIHAAAIAAGEILNSPTRNSSQPAVEVSAQAANKKPQSEQTAKPTENREKNVPSAPPRRVMPKSFPDFQVSRTTRQYIQLISLVLIYGSYLYLKVRKAKKSRENKEKRKLANPHL
jgi:DMSO/TMAO reductase YedYZ heme-binding membrane subunit